MSQPSLFASASENSRSSSILSCHVKQEISQFELYQDLVNF